MVFKTSFISLAILFLLASCSNNNQGNTSNADTTKAVKEVITTNVTTVDSNVIKVYVDKTGQITANGAPVSLKDLDSSFNKLKASNGVVYYSRDNVQAEPPAESLQVMELVAKYSLSIKFYTDKTFTQTAKID